MERVVARYLIGRLLQAAVTLFFIALITFLLMHTVPGGPFEALAGERAVSQQFVRSQEAYYCLDDPLPAQFGRYLLNLLKGDLGISFAHRGQRVTELLLDRMKPSLILGGMSMVMVIGAGMPLGVLSAIRRNTVWDHGGLAIVTVLAAVPGFVLAFLLILVFAVWLDLFSVKPVTGFGDSVGSLSDGILPALALGGPAAALLARLTRGAMFEVLRTDYMRTARSKGLSDRAVYLRHGAPNALIPVIAILGPISVGLVTGSIVIESVFGLPGIGSTLVTSIHQRDYGVIMGTTLLYSTLITLANLVVDLSYPLIDPRVRLAR